MEEYMNKYDEYTTAIVYNFNLGDGGIGDCIKFFMFILEKCMKDKTRLYYKKNNIPIEKYIKLKYDKMYNSKGNIVDVYMYYSEFNYDYSIPIQDVFYFTDEVKINASIPISNYISIHLRLGDKFLETDTSFIVCKNDAKSYDEEKIYKFIEDNSDKPIFFCSDNTKYKVLLKEKYKNIFVTTFDIGHTSLLNTTDKQTLDAISELYILSNSELLYRASESGFSMIASKFKNIPIQN